MAKIFDNPSKYSISVFEKYIFGIKGKKAIYFELSKLSDDYAIFTDIQIIDVTVDFIVLGPTGIYSIIEKSHEVTLGYNGEELTKWKQPFEDNFLSHANSEASLFKKYLHIKLNKYFEIIPVLVFSSRFAKMTFGLSPIRDVLVIPKKLLSKLINERSIILNTGEIEEIKEILELKQKTTK